MTKQEAIEKGKSNWWKTKTAREIVEFQLYEPLLCMDFGDLHKAVEEVLGRPVWIHEFGSAGRLKEEFEGIKKAPSIEEIVGMFPSRGTK